MSGIMAAAGATVRGVSTGLLHAAIEPNLTTGFFHVGNLFAETDVVLVRLAGGLGPFTVSWEKLSGPDFDVIQLGDGPPWLLVFRFEGLLRRRAIYRITVTDSDLPPRRAFADVAVIANPTAGETREFPGSP